MGKIIGFKEINHGDTLQLTQVEIDSLNLVASDTSTNIDREVPEESSSVPEVEPNNTDYTFDGWDESYWPHHRPRRHPRDLFQASG